MTRQDKLKDLYRELYKLEWHNRLDNKAIVDIRTEIRRLRSSNSFGDLVIIFAFIVALTITPLVVFYKCMMHYGLSNFFSQMKYQYKNLFESVEQGVV